MNSNQINEMLQFINNGGDPFKLVENNMRNNPQYNQMFQQIKGMMTNGNMSGKDFAIQYLQKMGIDAQQVEMLASRLGVK